jgi:hypothetical protein
MLREVTHLKWKGGRNKSELNAQNEDVIGRVSYNAIKGTLNMKDVKAIVNAHEQALLKFKPVPQELVAAFPHLLTFHLDRASLTPPASSPTPPAS